MHTLPYRILPAHTQAEVSRNRDKEPESGPSRKGKKELKSTHKEDRMKKI